MAQPRFEDLTEMAQIFIDDVERDELAYGNIYNDIHKRQSARDSLIRSHRILEGMIKDRNKPEYSDYTDEDWVYFSLTRDAILLNVLSIDACRLWKETLERAANQTDYHSLAVAESARLRKERGIQTRKPAFHPER